MGYTIPQLEGLAQAISKINEDVNSNEITGDDAIKALESRGLI